MKTDKKYFVDCGEALVLEFMNDNEKEKRYIINDSGNIAGRKEERINFSFFDHNIFHLSERNYNISRIDLNKKEVENCENRKWYVELVADGENTAIIRLHNKTKKTFMYWEFKKIDNEWHIMGEWGNENVFDNPKHRFNFEKGEYWDYDKGEYLKIKDLIKEKK